MGRVLGERFRVLERIAAGGMGVVYLAEQMPLGRKVAVKVLSTGNVEDASALKFRERFLLEAASVSRLSHPNTIVVHDYGSVDDTICYIVMEYIPGVTLGRELDQGGPLPPPRALQIAVQITGSLQEAHEMGLVHRDLKPGNIMLTRRGASDEFVKVLDFGLVKPMDDDNRDLTHSDAILGSPRYMGPEQIQGTRVDARTDIYAFGTVMYHMLTGTAPFTQGSRFQILASHINDAPAPFRAKFPRCEASPRLEALVMKCLAKSADDRPQSMTDVARELLGCMADLGLSISGHSGISGSIASLRAEPAAGSSDVPRGIPPTAREGETSGSSAVSAVVPAARAAAISAPAIPVAEPPPRSNRGGAIALGAFVLVAAAGAYLAFGRGTAPSAAPGNTAAEHASAATSAGAAVTSVAVVTNPPGAHVRRAGRDLGDTPMSLVVPTGERWSVDIELPGYVRRSVEVSGGQHELNLRLDPEPVAPANTARNAAPAPPPPVAEPPPAPPSATPHAARSWPAHAAARTPHAPAAAGAPAGTTAPAPHAPPPNAHPEGWSGTRGDNRDPWAQ